MTISASSANSVVLYASAPTGRSERPLPRPSKVTTRKCLARYGICAFQNREWMIDHVGSSRLSARPSRRPPKTRARHPAPRTPPRRVASACLLRRGGVGYLNQGHLLQRTLSRQRASSVKRRERRVRRDYVSLMPRARLPRCLEIELDGGATWRRRVPGAHALLDWLALERRARSQLVARSRRTWRSVIRGHFLAAAARSWQRGSPCARGNRLTQLEIAVSARVPMNKHTPRVLLRQRTRTHRSAGSGCPEGRRATLRRAAFAPCSRLLHGRAALFGSMAVAVLSPHLDDAVLSCWHALETWGCDRRQRVRRRSR